MKKIGASTYFSILIGVGMSIAVIDAIKNMPILAAIYPAVVASMLIVLSTIQVINDFRKGQSTEGALDIEKADTTLKVRYYRGSRAFMWIMVLYLAIFLFGFKVGAVVFLFAYLSLEDKGGWVKIGLVCAGMFLFLDCFRRFLGVWWSTGLMGNILDESVPWLF